MGRKYKISNKRYDPDNGVKIIFRDRTLVTHIKNCKNGKTLSRLLEVEE